VGRGAGAGGGTCRLVLTWAGLRGTAQAPESEQIIVDGKDVVPDVHEVLSKIEDFSNLVRSGEWLGATGEPLTDVVCIGIGGR
jgi:glucose-6-phosphate isomerase